MNGEKRNKIMSSEELDDVLPKYEPIKLSGKNLAQNYVSAFNTGMNIYQCVNYLQGNIDWTIKAVNDVVKSWNTEVSESIDQSKAIVRETTTEQFNTEWTNKQPELIEQVNTLTTNQFNSEITNLYSTPEKYGAVGDGISDDTVAIQKAFDDPGRIVILKKNAIYRITSTIFLKSNCILIGNYAKITQSTNTHLITIEPDEHDITIVNAVLEGFYGVESACVNIRERDLTTDSYDSARNITIQNCKISKGVFGIIATKASKIRVIDCEFSDFLYNPESVSGGYGILLQRSKDVNIERCEFSNVRNGRHDIYISCAGDVSHENNCCRDVVVRDCHFNHDTQTYYSPNTSAIMIRHSYNVVVENNRAENLMCLIATDTNQGIIDGLIAYNNYIEKIGGSYTTYESKSVFEINGKHSKPINAIIKNNMCIDGTKQSIYAFVNCSYGTVTIKDNVSKGEFDIRIGNEMNIILDNFVSNTKSNSVLRFLANDVVKGHISNVYNGGNYANIIDFLNNEVVSNTIFEKSAYIIEAYDGNLIRRGNYWFNPELTYDSEKKLFCIKILPFAKRLIPGGVNFVPYSFRTGYYIRVDRSVQDYDGQTLYFKLYNESGELASSQTELCGYFDFAPNI